MPTPVEKLFNSLTAKPVQPVTIVPNRLQGTEAIKFWISSAILLQFRTLVVWGFLALFFPQLGITWFMVMFGLYALRHALPPKTRDMVDLIAAQRK